MWTSFAEYYDRLYELPRWQITSKVSCTACRFNMYTFFLYKRNVGRGEHTGREAAAKIGRTERQAAGIHRSRKNSGKEQAISQVGTEIYEKTRSRCYTQKKQWGRPSTELPSFNHPAVCRYVLAFDN